MLLPHTNTRKRQRNPTLGDAQQPSDDVINQMLLKQTAYLNNNLTFSTPDEDAALDTTDVPATEDGDLIFVKEQPVQPVQTTQHQPQDYSASLNYTPAANPQQAAKKQRTVSLPQLPLSKLDIAAFTRAADGSLSAGGCAVQEFIPRTQNDDELLSLTGSSTRTLSANKQVSLRVLQPPQREQRSPRSPRLRLHHPSLFLGRRHSASSSSSASPSSHNDDGHGDMAPLPTDPFKTDKDGHYVYQLRDTFGENDRFVANDLLGQGTFGKVLKCYDNAQQKFVAVKIIRAIDRYREAAKTELRVLSTIANTDTAGTYQCLMLQDCFDYKNHICLVTNLHGKSVYDFMCANAIGRFPGSHIQAIARQVIRSIAFLHDMDIIHTDIKPENILLTNDQEFAQYHLPQNIVATLSKRRKLASNNGVRKVLRNPEVKIIDFGSAVFFNEYHPPIISTRHYRAPEIVLGLSWSYPCDIWSIACVLVELATGESLYPIHNNFEHLEMMQRVNNLPIPEKLIDTMFYKYDNNIGNLPNDLSTTVLNHFDRGAKRLMWPEVDEFTGKIVTEPKVIKRIENVHSLDSLICKFIKQDLHEPNFQIDSRASVEQNWQVLRHTTNVSKEVLLFWHSFLDLLNRMFEYDPTKRITAREALDHEWFDHGILDEGISAFY